MVFHIRSRPETYYAGVTADGEQSLLGWAEDTIVVLLFDRIGELRRVLREPITVDLSRGFGPVVEARVNEQIRSLQEKLGFQEKPIAVAPFAVPDLHIGLKPLSDDLEEYVHFPERFSSDAEWYESRLREWVSEGKSALTWGNNYYLTREGYSF
jgi:hypothetical protein